MKRNGTKENYYKRRYDLWVNLMQSKLGKAIMFDNSNPSSQNILLFQWIMYLSTTLYIVWYSVAKINKVPQLAE